MFQVFVNFIVSKLLFVSQLLDTERLYTELTQNIINEFGKTYTWGIENAANGKEGERCCQDAFRLRFLLISLSYFSDWGVKINIVGMLIL